MKEIRLTKNPSEQYAIVKIRDIFLRLDTTKDQILKDKILSELKDLCSWNNSHVRPSNLKNIKKLEEIK